MKSNTARTIGLILILSVALACATSRQAAMFKSIEGKTNAAVTPLTRDGAKLQRFELINKRIKEGPVDLIFVGDSITEGWETRGKDVWERYYAKRHAGNLGIGGDTTQHVLWRLDHGNIDGIHPKLAVVMIGTNNLPDGRSTPDETIDGVIAVCAKLRRKLPDTKILLLAIFPRSDKPYSFKDRIAKVNNAIAKLADGKTIFFMDIGSKFLAPDGSIPDDIMADHLHPSAKGYEIWAKAIEPTLSCLLGEK